jgi:uncharacterized protein YbjQ (UPF0145 family)
VKQIQGITFEEGGVVFQYADTDDIRKDGALQVMRTLFVGSHDDYRDGLADLQDKALEVLQDALEDFVTADVVDLESDDDEDNDDRGMGE